MHQVANQDPNYGKCTKINRFDLILLNVFEAQTSILPSFPKILVSRYSVCMNSRTSHNLASPASHPSYYTAYYGVAFR